MSISSQTTLKNKITCTGIGLHSGARICMTLHPAAPDTGRVFKRVDLDARDPAEILIPARYDYVSDTMLGTTLTNEAGVSIQTVEHLMAAIAGCGIDNVIIEIDGPEMPVMDGSSAPFVFLIECAGLVEQDAPRRYIRILEPVRFEDDGKVAEFLPGEGFSIDFEIEFSSAAISRQRVCVDLSDAGFKTELARARTFGFLHEAEHLRSLGLAQGASLDNSIVIDGDRILNEGGLRYADEFVRHKVLDAVGDLALAGAPIIGEYRAVKAGHRLNNEALKALFADRGAWEYTTDATGFRLPFAQPLAGEVAADVAAEEALSA